MIRDSVGVVIPFSGSAREAASLLERIGPLDLGPDDELVLVDNSLDVALAAQAPDSITVLQASVERSSYHARNVGAAAVACEWLLFIDADCRPAAGLISAYLEPPPAPNTAVVAGGIRAAAGQRSLVADYARSRGQLGDSHLAQPRDERNLPAGGTGNLLVRRQVWESLGGFQEGVCSGGDVELCWRAQTIGWGFEHRPEAAVEHSHVDSLRTLMAQAKRHAAGRRWVRRRFPGTFERPRLARHLGRALAGIVVWGVTLRWRRALYKAIDAVWFSAHWWGYLAVSNRPTPVDPTPGGDLVVFTDAYPARSETFVYNQLMALRDLGTRVRVESSSRPLRVERSVARELPLAYLEDDTPAEKARALLRLAIRHPLAAWRDRRSRHRWQREEESWPLAALAPAEQRLRAGGERHLHAHFAAAAALNAMRISRVAAIPYSVTAHAYELFRSPANLVEKLGAAAFAAAECEFTADHMRELAAGSGVEVHRITTGARPDVFKRSVPMPAEGRLVAIGRLVEKKGFGVLIDALAELGPDQRPSQVVIAGEGPLRDSIESRIRARGLEDLIELRANVWGAGTVRELLESADLVAIPSVVAADGDSDALPLVAYEALAMEVPVIASDLAGLPELVRPEWGELVAAGDSSALGEAISRLLALDPAERAAMGAAGRRHLLASADPAAAVERLAALLAAHRGGA